MKRTLVPLYRNSDLYTLFYDQDDERIYKIPFGKKGSIIGVYLIVVALIITGNLLDNIYQTLHSLPMDIGLIIIGIAIAYFTVNKMYKVYYMGDKIRPILLDESFLESCVSEGMKQSRREIIVIIVSFLFAVVAIIVFLIVNSVKPLIFGSLSTAIYLSFFYMKPLKRRKIIKKIRTENIKK